MDNPPFKILCYIFTRPNFREGALEYERFMGQDVLKSVFDKMEERKDVESLFLSFPENWLNILEQRQLYPRLEKYCPNLKELTLKTHSVYIIQCTKRESCRIVDDPSLVPETLDLDGRLYIEGVELNPFDLTKLNIVTPDDVKNL